MTIKLNYSHLSKETQEQLLCESKKDILSQFGQEIEKYSMENGIAYETLLEEEAIRNLYSFTFSFRI